jgi:hypothetical protein
LDAAAQARAYPDEHLLDMLLLADTLRGLARGFRFRDAAAVALRAGISHGPVAGAVVGAHRAFYCLYGDTVGVASKSIAVPRLAACFAYRQNMLSLPLCRSVSFSLCLSVCLSLCLSVSLSLSLSLPPSLPPFLSLSLSLSLALALSLSLSLSPFLSSYSHSLSLSWQVNTAARMCKLAEPDAVACAAPLAARLRAAATAAAAADDHWARLRCASRGVVQVKGKGPMETFRVTFDPAPPPKAVDSGLPGPGPPLPRRRPDRPSRRLLLTADRSGGGGGGGGDGGNAPRLRLSVLDFFARETPAAARAAGGGGAGRSVFGYLSPKGQAWTLDPGLRIGPYLTFRDAG